MKLRFIRVQVLFLAAVAFSSSRPAVAQTLTAIRVATGLDAPVFAGSPPGDFNRLFIVEQDGRIQILTGGAVLPTPYLDITAIVTSAGEQGLLGLAFHPNYSSNGYSYVNYIDDNGDTVIARYTVQGSPASSNVANPGSAVILKTIGQPESNHKGGCLQFGPDGMLYCGMGDGGGGNDQHGPIGNGQALNTLLGKMIRLDVSNPPNYIPADNPFVGAGDPLDEIWAIGFRNPWRFSFDRGTGDMYIGDVGQSAREEIDFQPSSSNGGENYGWRCMEGFNCTGLSGCTCNAPTLTLPIHDYDRNDGCSVTGGYVYRGTAIPGLQGAYFFADYCTESIWSFRYNGSVMAEFEERSGELDPDVGDISSISSFGEDAAGELYICDLSGEVFKIVPAGGCSPPAAAISALCSNRTHASGPCCIPIGGTIPSESTEPRSGGLQELRITFDSALCSEAFALDSAAVSIQQTDSTMYPALEAYSGPSVISTSGAGTTLILSFAPPLGDARAYRMTFTSAVTSQSGQRFDVRALTGDVNSDGQTNGGDRSMVIGGWTGGGFTCPADVNRDGLVDAGDRSVIVNIWTSGAADAP